MRFLILRHMSYLIFNFVPSELFSVKIKESKYNHLSVFIFVANELLGVKTEEFKTN